MHSLSQHSLAGAPMASLAAELGDLRSRDLWRSLQELPQLGGTISQGSRQILNLSCNDYLGLTQHPRVREAAIRALQDFGCGATASRLVTGNTKEHDGLEACLAQCTGQDAALAFPSGYQANLAVLSTLAGREDILYSDAMNHASLIDGCRLSRARVRIYQHKDMVHLAALLAADSAVGARRKLIVSESLFSMDGDIAPVGELRHLADEHGALLVIDEAHAIGVFGKRGGGLCRAAEAAADVVLGTLSKALGSQGGFAAANRTIIDYLINRARPFIYSTGLAPSCAAAARAALEILADTHGLGETLRARAAAFSRQLSENGCAITPSLSQIQPIILGANSAALEAAAALREADILAVAIRPPTVPEDTARLRLSVTLGHSEEALRHAAQVIAATVERVSGHG